MNILRKDNNIKEIETYDQQIARLKAEDMVINAHFKHNGGPFKNVSMMVTKVHPNLNFLLNAEALFASTGEISVKGAL